MFLSFFALIIGTQPTFGGPSNPEYQIVCKRYLGNSNEELPDGIVMSYDQKIKNFLRCYNEQVKSAEKSCKKIYDKQRCKNRTTQWISNTFMLNLSNPQVAQQLGRCNRRRNLMINIRNRR